MINFSDLTDRLQQVNFGLASEFCNFIEKYNAKIVNDYKVDTNDVKTKDGKIISTTTKTPIGKKIIKNFELSNGWINFKVVIFENSKICKCTINTRDGIATYEITYKSYSDFAKQFNKLLDENSGCLYEIDKLNTEA